MAKNSFTSSKVPPVGGKRLANQLFRRSFFCLASLGSFTLPFSFLAASMVEDLKKKLLWRNREGERAELVEKL